MFISASAPALPSAAFVSARAIRHADAAFRSRSLPAFVITIGLRCCRPARREAARPCKADQASADCSTIHRQDGPPSSGGAFDHSIDVYPDRSGGI